MATTTAARPAIAVTGRQKSFGDKDVLDSIDLTVQEGTIFALLCIGRRHSLLPTLDEVAFGSHEPFSLAVDPLAISEDKHTYIRISTRTGQK